jgi:hypothetical protein
VYIGCALAMRFLPPKPLFALLAALVPVLAVPRAWAAQEPTPTELSVARHLFDEGRAAEDAGRWREAADKFRKATTIKDTPGMRFHLARCEEEQGAFVEALVEYDRARELLDSGVRAVDVEKLLAGARERVRAKVALLTLRLPSDVQNVSVELDGNALSGSVLGGPMPINPGRHRLVAVAVGRTKFSNELELGTGEVRQVAIELPIAMTVPVAAPAPSAAGAIAAAPVAAAASAPHDSAFPARTIALVGEAALSVVGIGTGIGFLVARSSAHERYDAANELVLSQPHGQDDSACAAPSPLAGCADLDQAQKDGKRDGDIATIGFVAAGISAAAFGLTLGLWHANDAPAQVHASVAPGRLALSVSGRF